MTKTPSNVVGLPPRRDTYTTTRFHRVIEAADRAGGDAPRQREIMAAIWAAVADALTQHPAGDGARIHIKVEVERPA